MDISGNFLIGFYVKNDDIDNESNIFIVSIAAIMNAYNMVKVVILIIYQRMYQHERL